MRKVPQKNYFIVIAIIIATIILTLFFAYIYNKKEMKVSDFYTYSNKISGAEFVEYISERTDLIIYISDKYDLSNSIFEKRFENKIDDLSLKDKLIYIDKEDLNESFIEYLKDNNVSIDKENLPVIIVMIDGTFTKIIQVNDSLDVNSVIEYEDFE